MPSHGTKTAWLKLARFRACFLGALMLSLAIIAPAMADAQSKEVQTIIRAISFVDGGKASGTPFYIIYDPAKPATSTEAQQILSLLKSEGQKISPTLVSVGSIGSLQPNSYAYVTDNLNSSFSSLKRTLIEKNILSFTSDRHCVEQNCCMVYIDASNKVEIIVNKTIADSLKTQFKPVFLMMVKMI